MAQPQNHSDPPAPSAVPLLVALGAGLVVAMLVAVLTPTADEGTNWLIVLVAGVAAAAVAYFVAGRRGTTTVRRPGEH
jgi:predicted anti-sigma-YlaC factor YlaD